MDLMRREIGENLISRVPEINHRLPALKRRVEAGSQRLRAKGKIPFLLVCIVQQAI